MQRRGNKHGLCLISKAQSPTHFSCRRRARRAGEVHGRDYFFVSREQFEEWLRADSLLEHAIVYGDYKGIPRQQVLAVSGFPLYLAPMPGTFFTMSLKAARVADCKAT